MRFFQTPPLRESAAAADPMNRVTTNWFWAALLLIAVVNAAPTVGNENDEEEKFVVIKAGRVITLAGEEIRSGEIVLVDGKIRLVGKDLEYPKSAEVIDAPGEVVMPGLIHPRTRWQLPSYSRSGIHADRSVAKEVYFEEINFQPLLESGFTSVCFYPQGTGIPGPAVVYRTAGPSDDRELGSAYLRVTMSTPGRDKKTVREAIDKARKEIEKVEKARKEWEEKQKKAKEEAAKKEKEAGDKSEEPTPEKKDDSGKDKGEEDTNEKDGGSTAEKEDNDKTKPEEKEPDKFTAPQIDPAVKPLVDWIRDKKGPPLLFELSKASDLRHLDDVLKQASELPCTRLFLAGTYSPDYHHIVKDLGEREAVVLAAPDIGQLPLTIVRYNLPAELTQAGCTVALLPTSDSTSQLKQLRSRLGQLVRAGLARDDALKAVTINAAKLLGLEDRLGTIEKGKDADLVFLDGDPLTAETRITRVMTFGEIAWEAPKQP